jgi:hypothetical protein
MALPHFLPHVLYSLAITSLSIHLILHKKEVDAQRANLTAQISILESIAQRLKWDKPPDDELKRLKRLARAHEAGSPVQGLSKDLTVSWKDVILGAKRPESSGEVSSWDRKDLDKGNQDSSS